MMEYSRYKSKNNSSSLYCYPNTYILINKLDIQDENLLKEAEKEFTTQRLIELQKKPISGRFSVSHLKNIHKYIFQDIFYFAGEFRKEDIMKDNTMFAKSQYIDDLTNKLLLELKNEDFKEYDKQTFSKRLAYYMAELNVIHPFREGNGRTIREFIRSIAIKNKYKLNWSSINPEQLLNASIKSMSDITPLSKCLFDTLNK